MCQDISQSEFRINTRQSAAAPRNAAKRTDAVKKLRHATQRSKPRVAAHRQSDVALRATTPESAAAAVEGICGTKPTLIRKDNSYSSISVRNAKFDLMSPIEKKLRELPSASGKRRLCRVKRQSAASLSLPRALVFVRCSAIVCIAPHLTRVQEF